jgi:hypothetical protein
VLLFRFNYYWVLTYACAYMRHTSFIAIGPFHFNFNAFILIISNTQVQYSVLCPWRFTWNDSHQAINKLFMISIHLLIQVK